MSVSGIYFDGISARRQVVTLALLNGQLRLEGDGIERSLIEGDFTIPGKLGHTARLILFANGARCEITDHVGFDRLIADTGIAPSLVGHLESRWHYAMTALALTLALIAATYVWGLPYAAERIASRIPARVQVMIDAQFMNTFDGKLLEPSHLSAERQQIISGRLLKLRMPPGGTPPTHVLFRSSPPIGPNAFALPGGTVVVLDEIVNLSSDDDEILAVLAHEMGHVAERHALRQMLQASVVGLAMTWYVGDISTLLAAAPTTLLETRYSRDFERRADAFGARMLKLNGISPGRLADILEKLEHAHARKGEAPGGSAMDYLSTHPNTAERIRTLRQMQ